MASPTTISWQGPTTYTDGSSFDSDDLAGWQILVDDKPAVSVPAQWNVDNEYSFPLASLSLSPGQHAVRLQTVAANGQVSVPTSPVQFVMEDERIPRVPFGVTVE